MSNLPAARRQRSDAVRSRTAVVDAAVDLLGRQPGASVEEIATAAGVTRQTVYAHHPSGGRCSPRSWTASPPRWQPHWAMSTSIPVRRPRRYSGGCSGVGSCCTATRCCSRLRPQLPRQRATPARSPGRPREQDDIGALGIWIAIGAKRLERTVNLDAAPQQKLLSSCSRIRIVLLRRHDLRDTGPLAGRRPPPGVRSRSSSGRSARGYAATAIEQTFDGAQVVVHDVLQRPRTARPGIGEVVSGPYFGALGAAAQVRSR